MKSIYLLGFCFLLGIACALSTEASITPTTQPVYNLFILYRATHSPLENHPSFLLYGAPTTETYLEGDVLRVIDKSSNESSYGFFYRNDPLAPTDYAVMEFQMRVRAASSSVAVQAGFLDGVKYAQVGIMRDRVGIPLAGDQWIASTPLDATVFHTYRLVKNGREALLLYVDDKQLLTVPYAELVDVGVEDPRAGFGAGSSLGTSDSEWQSVWYRIESQSSP